MNFNIIGAGRLGKNIALALTSAKLASLKTICNSSLESSTFACEQLGAGRAVRDIADLPAANCTWITCNDDSIQPMVANLLERTVLKPGDFVIHTSGVHNSALLAPLKKQGCLVASFHPLKAFKQGYLDANAFLKVDCIIEGDEAVCSWLIDGFTRLGAFMHKINPEAKSIYHSAASMASNYLVTLAACSEELFLEAGIEVETARTMICKLMQGNLNNIQHSSSIKDSLTGPLARGDIKTLALHLQAIKDPLVQNLYKSAGRATLPLTALDSEQKDLIFKLFD